MDLSTIACFRCVTDMTTYPTTLTEGTVDSCAPSVAFTVLFILCGIITVFSNIVNLVALAHTQQCFNDNTRLCFQAVAVVDFFVGLFCCTFHSIRFSGLSISRTRTFSIIGVIGCSTLFNQSIMILACVSIDRYLAVTRPLRYHAIVTKRRMIVLIVFGMFVGTMNSSASLAHKIIAGFSDLKFASVDIASNPILVIYFALILTSAGVTTFCNTVLVILARKHRRRIAATSCTSERSKAGDTESGGHQRSGNKDIRTIFAVTGAFYITWGAQVSVNFTSAALGKEMPCIARNILLIFVISNSFWNALIYLLMNSSFRRIVWRMFTRDTFNENAVHTINA
nr:probable G-protein coupled receptor 21 [Lytechinus pictus]